MPYDTSLPQQREIALANARLVLETEVVLGSLLIRDGVITSIDPGTGVPAGALDLEGDFLAPGLIELHTDNLERRLEPRPGASWPSDAAVMAHNSELAGTGITTVFDALRVGSLVDGGKVGYLAYARRIATVIRGLQAAGALRLRHHLHLRAEICSETLVAELGAFAAEDDVRLLSLMDHTPGQRQFTDVEKLRAYSTGPRAMSDAEFDTHLARMRDLQERHGARHEAEAVAAARRFGATLASHDDTTPEQVAASAALGVGVAEFPTTLAAARACREAGIPVIAGAPNLMRGASHSGNVSAAALAEAGLLDILSSDYIPASLLGAAVLLGMTGGNMARGIATATAAPARATGLADRGRIAPGLAADLLHFRLVGERPRVSGVWVGGHRVS